jgi:PRTRC genetic system protein A
MEALHLERLDAFVQQTTPVVVATHARAVADLESAGHRYIVAADGVYAQFRRAWCRGAVQVSQAIAPLPFGRQAVGINLACGRIPRSLFDQFVEVARERCPLEVAAWITWREGATTRESAWTLRTLNTLTASGGHVRFDRPTLDSGEHLVIDIHSHGLHDAHFSDTDDADDADVSIVKIAAVVGHLSTEVTSVMRLCAAGAHQYVGEIDEILDASR